MGLMHEVRREVIAVPDTHKGQIVYKWPDQNIRKFTRAIVEPDAVAVFMSQGQVMGVVPPGQHTLDARELPFLGLFVDWASDGDAFLGEAENARIDHCAAGIGAGVHGAARADAPARRVPGPSPAAHRRRAQPE